MGNLELPKDLGVGEIRELNEDEIDEIGGNSITK